MHPLRSKCNLLASNPPSLENHEKQEHPHPRIYVFLKKCQYDTALWIKIFTQLYRKKKEVIKIMSASCVFAPTSVGRQRQVEAGSSF